MSDEQTISRPVVNYKVHSKSPYEGTKAYLGVKVRVECFCLCSLETYCVHVCIPISCIVTDFRTSILALAPECEIWFAEGCRKQTQKSQTLKILFSYGS